MTGRSADPLSAHNGAAANAVCRLHFGAQTFTLDPSGAAYWHEQRALLVADLHLEKGSAFAKRGMFLPPYDSAATLSRLAGAIARYRPAHVVALGDSFHDTYGAMRLAPEERDRLSQMQEGLEWTWLTGNHDPHADVNALTDGSRDAAHKRTLEKAELSGIELRHEPACHLDNSKLQIAGHFHPVARVAARRGGARRRCFVADNNSLILPAFGAFTGGLNVLSPVFSTIFPQLTSAFVAVLGQNEVYPIPPSRLAPDFK
ncbi:MAG: ligase-associated DNA damage response endonuclease PdeM [Pseudomonadota bacterium]